MSSITPQKEAPVLPPQAQQGEQMNAEQPPHKEIPVYGFVAPPPAPIVAQQPEYVYNPHQQQAKVIVDPATTNAAIAAKIPTANVDECEEAQQMKYKWRRYALIAIVFGTFLMILGISFMKIRKDAPYGSCCLPAGCDVSKLQDLDWSVESAAEHTGRRCTFTTEEMAIMGCADRFNLTSQCSLSTPSRDGDHSDWDPCGHNEVVGQMLGAAICAVVVGALCIVTALCFFLWPVSCYGGIQRVTCCNWIARATTALIWQTAFGGAITGIVFGSMSVRGLTKKPLQTRSSCSIDSDDEDADCKDYRHRATRDHQDKHEHHRPIFWEGPNCTISGEHAEVFSFIEGSAAQKAHAGTTLFCSIAFTIMTIVVFVKCIRHLWRHCCGKKAEEGTPYGTATEMAAAPQPVVTATVSQPSSVIAPSAVPYPMNSDGSHHRREDEPIYGYPVQAHSVTNYDSGNNRQEEHQHHAADPIPGAVVTKADPPMIDNMDNRSKNL